MKMGTLRFIMGTLLVTFYSQNKLTSWL